MKEIPAEIRVLYNALLVQKKTPKKSRFYYRKWLRYYLDFCQKYNFKQSDKESVSHFIKKSTTTRKTDGLILTLKGSCLSHRVHRVHRVTEIFDQNP